MPVEPVEGESNGAEPILEPKRCLDQVSQRSPWLTEPTSRCQRTEQITVQCRAVPWRARPSVQYSGAGRGRAGDKMQAAPSIFLAEFRCQFLESDICVGGRKIGK